jgi:Fe-S-cluster-containing dehydrogenase component
MSNKVNFLNKDYTRRQFLKLSGKTLAGVTLSSSMLATLGLSAAAAENATVWAMPQGLLVVDPDKCTGCLRCEINCSLVNDGVVSSHLSRIKMARNLTSSRNGNGLYTENTWVYFPDTCRQCENPACGNACPVKAIYADENGVKKVDESKCVGCGACAAACPWKMPTINPETKKSTKCVQCGACAAGCVTGALKIVPWEAIAAAAQAV